MLQVLFSELDDKLLQATSLLTRATSSQSHCVADSELSRTVDKLRSTALNTRDAANKSRVSSLTNQLIMSENWCKEVGAFSIIVE